MQIIRRAILALTLAAGLAPAFAQAPPPVPALPDTERRTSYTISGTTCACSVGFALYGDSADYQNWVEVFVNGVRVNYNDPAFGWNITSPTGPIATIPRPITDAVLTFNSAQTGTIQIVGARRPRRITQFSENRGVAARDLNQALTDIIAQNRETWDRTNDVTGRAVLTRPGETIALLPVLANRLNLGTCFDNNGNLTTCVSVPSSTFSAGTGIAFTGTNPTTITNNILPGNGIAFTGSNPVTITNNMQAGTGIAITGTNPQTITNNIVAGTGIALTGTNPVTISTRNVAAGSTLNLYVDTGGSDANDCLSALLTHACRTIQHAHDLAVDNYILQAGASVTINVPANETFSATGTPILATNRHIPGCSGTSCETISCASNTTSIIQNINGPSAIHLGAEFGYGDGFELSISNCFLTSTGAGSTATIVAQGRGNLAIPGVNLGSTYSSHLYFGHGALLSCSSFTVSGQSTLGGSGGYLLFLYDYGWACLEGQTVTIANNMTYIATVAVSNLALCACAAVTFSVGANTVFGSKYTVTANGVLQGAANIAGSTAGTTSTGGQAY